MSTEYSHGAGLTGRPGPSTNGADLGGSTVASPVRGTSRNLVVVPDVTTDYAESHNPNGTPNPITLAMLVPDDFWRAYLGVGVQEVRAS